MQAKRKVLLAVLALLLVLTTAMTAAVVYVYRHPDLLRHALAKAISQKTGLSATIGSLSLSRKPWRVQVLNLALTPEGETPGGQALMGTLEAHMAFSGPLGRRTLSIKQLKVVGFSLVIPPGARIPASLSAPPVSPSMPVRLLTRLSAFLLFSEIRLVALEVRDGQLSIDTGTHQVQVRGIHGGFDTEHGLEVVCSLDAVWAAGKARVRVPRLRLFETAPTGGKFPLSAVRLEAHGVTMDSPEADVAAVDLLADLRHDAAHRRLEVEAAQLRCRRVTLKGQGDRTVRLPELVLDLSGVMGLDTYALAISGWRLSAENLLVLTGTAQANLGLSRAVHIKVEQGSVWPGGLTPLFAGGQSPGKGILQIDGLLQLRGALEGREAAGAWGWQCDLEASLDDYRFAWRRDPWHLSGKVSGTIAARGLIPFLTFSGHLRSPKVEVSGLPITLDPFQAEVTLSGTYPVLRLDRLRVDLPAATLLAGSELLRVADIGVLLTQGQMDLVTGKLLFPDVQVSSALLRNLHLAVERAGGHNNVRISGKGTRLMGSVQSLGILPPGWPVEADDALWVELAWQDGGSGEFKSRIDFQKIGFQDTPGRFMGENIQLQVHSQGRFGLKNRQVQADISLKAAQGEVLIEHVYLNLGQNPLEAKIQGRYQAPRRRLTVSNLTLTLGGMARAALQGEAVLTAGGFQSRLTVKLPPTPIVPLFQQFILEPFRMERPFLNDIHVAGDVSTELDGVFAPSGASLKGHISWRQGALARQRAPVAFTGINLEFPVWAVFGKPGPAGGALPGRLRVDSMHLPLLPEQSLDLQLAGLPGRLAVTTATTISLPTGFLQVDPVQVRNLYTPSIEAETAVRINGVDLPALLGSLGHDRLLPEFTRGRLGGQIDPLRLAGNVLTGLGEITADMLGGQIQVVNPRIAGLFTTTPVFRGDVRFESINLKALTAQTAFGRIDGIFNGHIVGLEIAHGQPQRFDLLLETVAHKDTPQRISVQAVDNIAQLGGGQSPFLGMAGGMVRLFKNFPYRKIGVHAVLENDVFRINGTIHEGGREYLMKRGGFSGVDVVNLNPDNRISFRDMLKRIKRIGSSEGGPVVR